MTMRTLILAVAMLAAMPVAAQQAGGAMTVTVGVSPSTDMSLLIVAVQKGFLEKEGVKAQMQLFDSSPAALQGVVAGRADITNNTGCRPSLRSSGS
jgi:ABC-type nitrate/sulfonate/bicarbonate transport system substrate-binding protein